MERVYLVIGSNNFWYAIEDTKKDAIAHAKSILADDGENGSYGDEETGYEPSTPESVHIYRAFKVAEIEGEDDEEV